MKKSDSVHNNHHQQQQQSDYQQQVALHLCPHSGSKAFSSATANTAKSWPIKFVLLLCCICFLLSACSAEPSASGNGGSGNNGDTLTSNSPSSSAFDSDDLIMSALTPPSESNLEDCLSPEDCFPSLAPKSQINPIFHNNQAAQLLPQLVQRYLRELDSTGRAAFAVPRSSGSSSSTTIFKSVPYPIAQLLLARLRNGGLRGAAEVSAEPMLALTPIRKQRGNQLKMANRFGKRDRLRMSNRFGRR